MITNTTLLQGAEFWWAKEGFRHVGIYREQLIIIPVSLPLYLPF